MANTLAAFSKNWTKITPDRPFEYFFLNEAFDKLYHKESRTGTLFSYFTFLALLIACLGMFALAAILSRQRTKEIGIRKILGASVSNIVGLLSKDFLRLVGIAIVLASPLAWWGMNQWLQDFAYRVQLEWWVFALAGALTVGIAFLTVSFQSVKAALSNPVEALRVD